MNSCLESLRVKSWEEELVELAGLNLKECVFFGPLTFLNKVEGELDHSKGGTLTSTSL